jgi:outer membrane protein
MPRLQSVLLAGAAMALMATPAAAQTSTGMRIAFIDSRKIIAEAPGAAEAQATFEREMTRWHSELEQLEAEINTLLRTYEQQQVMWTPDRRQQQADIIRQKQREFDTRADQLERQAATRQAELVDPIMDRVSGVIEEFRKEAGYDFILDVSGGTIIAADPRHDMTAQIITRLKSTAGNR